MINLLPDTSKHEIRAARANVVLLRYNLFTLLAIALLAIICILFYVILHNSQSNAVSTSTDNNAIVASYDDTRKQADEYRNNLSIAKAILANGANYTDVIFAITKLLPSGVILDGITINAADFGQQTSFTAHAKTYDKATELKKNFQDSSMFSNVYFQNLSDDSSAGATTDYPITITLSAKLNEVSK